MKNITRETIVKHSVSRNVSCSVYRVS